MMKILLIVIISISLYWPQIYSQQVIHVDLKATDIAYSSVMKKLFINGYDEEDNRSKIYMIDAYSGKQEVVLDLHLGYRSLDVSQDGSMLYVGCTDSDSSVIVVNLPAFNIANVFSIRPSPTAPLFYLRDLKVSPHDPNIVAVIRYDNSNDGHGEVVIYDHGVPRPNTFGADENLSVFCWSPDRPFIYAKDNYSSGNAFYMLRYDDLGVQAIDTFYHYMNGNAELIPYKDRIYGSDRSVIDVSKDYGIFYGDVSIQGFSGTFVDPVHDQIISFNNHNDKIEMLAFDPDRLIPIGDPITIPGIGYEFTDYISLQNGRDFAVLGSDDMMIVRFCTSTPSAPVLDPSFDQSLTLCIDDQQPIVIPTPPGYTFVIDQDGISHDTLRIIEEGIYTIQVADANGCLSPPSHTIKVGAAHDPGKPTINIWNGIHYEYQANVPVCTNGKTLLKIFPSDGITYKWSNGFLGYRQETTDTGNFWAIAVNARGCQSDTSKKVHVYQNGLTRPDPPEIYAQDGFNACNNLDNVVLIAESGYVKYHWDAETESSGVKKTVYSNSGSSFKLRGTNAEGCWSDFSSAEVHFYDLDPVFPSIKVVLNYLSPNQSAFAYEWFLDDEPLPNSNLQVWRALIPGDYQVRVFDGLCWSKLSFKKTIE